jgi:hypothetical protein
MLLTKVGRFLPMLASLSMLVFGAPARAQDQQSRHQPAWPCAGNVDPVYVRTAEATGGMVRLFKAGEIEGVAAEMAASGGHPEVLFRASATLEEGVYDFNVPVDSTIESAYIFASMQCLQAVQVMEPSGHELRTDVTGVEHHAFDAIRLFVVPTPAPGIWRVRIAGRGFLSLIVKASTDLSLTNVSFAERGHPLKRLPQRLEIRMSGEAAEVAFQAVSSAGAPLAPLTLKLEPAPDGRRTYAGEVTPPKSDFRVAMMGIDAKGFPFQRVARTLELAER